MCLPAAFRLFLAIFFIALISSCGGGGGGNSSPGSATPPAQKNNLPVFNSVTEASFYETDSFSMVFDITDADSDSLNVTVRDLPTWLTFDSAALLLTGQSGLDAKGIYNFDIVIDDGHQVLVTTTMTLTVEGVISLTGKVVDGYISGALVYIDENNNGQYDVNERSTITNEQGGFTLYSPESILAYSSIRAYIGAGAKDVSRPELDFSEVAISLTLAPVDVENIESEKLSDLVISPFSTEIAEDISPLILQFKNDEITSSSLQQAIIESKSELVRDIIDIADIKLSEINMSENEVGQMIFGDYIYLASELPSIIEVGQDKVDLLIKRADIRDSDGDGQVNNIDNDDDNDGVDDELDAFPLDNSEFSDSDLDGVGDNSDSYPYAQNGNLWNTYQGDSKHTGHVKFQTHYERFELIWDKEITSSSSSSSYYNSHHSLSISEEFAFISIGKTLFSISTFNGDILWSKDFSVRDSLNSPAYSDGRIYVQTGGHSNSFLWGLDAVSGDVLFNSSYGNQWSSYHAPTIYGDDVFVAGGSYGGMYGFNKETGNEFLFKNLTQYDLFTPAVTEDYVIAHTEAQLTVINKATGLTTAEIQDSNFNWNGWSMGVSPVVTGDNRVVTTQAGRLILFDLSTNSIAWEKNDNYQGQVTVDDYGIYAIKDNSLEVLSESDGSLLWSWVPLDNLSLNSQIITTLDYVFINAGTVTLAIDKLTHEPVWTFPLAGTMALSNGILYISTSGRLVAINLEGDTDSDGLPQWWERRYGGDLLPESDDDDDGLTALEEFEQGTSPLIADTDNDGLSDGDEVNTHLTSPVLIDSDKDGLSDYDEIILHGSNANAVDSDDDGINDAAEVANNLDVNDGTDAAQDFDEDGYSNLHEVFAGSDLNDALSIPVVSDWAMVQGNASHNGYQAILLDSDNFSEQWSQTFNYNVSAAAIGAGQLFITGDQALTALDIGSGDENWSYAFNNLHAISSPSLGNGYVYMHSGGHEDTGFWAFDAGSGEQVFRGEHSSQWPRYSAPTIFGDKAFMNGAHYGGMQGFDALTGENLWQGSADWSDYWEPAVDENSIYVISGNNIIIRDYNGTDEGSIEANISTQTLVLGHNNNIVSYGEQLRSFDIASQAEVWSSTATGGNYSMPAVGNGQVYSIQDGILKAFNELTGESQWQWSTSTSLNSNIVLTASHVFVGTSTNTYAINVQTHDDDWSTNTSGALSLGNEGMLLIQGSRTLTAIDVEGDTDSDGLP